MITVIFARNDHWISRLVRWRTNSQWSHVGILDGDYVIEAMGSTGVRQTPLAQFYDRYTHHTSKQLPGDIEKARYLIGSDFDLWGLWGVFFRSDELQSSRKWFCSELVAYATGLYDETALHKVTPEHLYWLRCNGQQDEIY